MSVIQVYSEIGPLKQVLLKRPGAEVENMTPESMNQLLFDDIPYLKSIQKEHDAFAQLLQAEGVEVLYLEELVAQAITTSEQQQDFLDLFLQESGIAKCYLYEGLKEYLVSFNTTEMLQKLMAGVRQEEVGLTLTGASLSEMLKIQESPFYLAPLPSLYFPRDILACIGTGISIHPMSFEARKRESLFVSYLYEHHPLFTDKKTSLWFDRDLPWSLEGGDILVLSAEVVAVGISQRTKPQAIELLAQRLFAQGGFTKVLAIKIPPQRAMMHLDTVFTMVDVEKFTIHPEILSTAGHLDIYVLEPQGENLKITREEDLRKVLKEALKLAELTLIPTGGGDRIAAAREQWNDGSNTLALAPGKVVTYDRNHVSNKQLREAGVQVLEIASGELSRGRGGPRCMSQPFWRERL
ncbi:arginine deiminase [Enterococcus asini]|uniref:arginine deiminase n=1 Tax=Enterococcus asini TaxID=57732 RepID=UPI001E61054D|nr:arginine deiminase [Enterococcus asini]MCD5029018.1 arginine deiminase [Enterococcus asini]MDT2783937.1 arginine deiminase [Enterococcus asini]